MQLSRTLNIVISTTMVGLADDLIIDFTKSMVSITFELHPLWAALAVVVASRIPQIANEIGIGSAFGLKSIITVFLSASAVLMLSTPGKALITRTVRADMHRNPEPKSKKSFSNSKCCRCEKSRQKVGGKNG